jgi:hypothetical protein
MKVFFQLPVFCSDLNTVPGARAEPKISGMAPEKFCIFPDLGLDKKTKPKDLWCIVYGFRTSSRVFLEKNLITVPVQFLIIPLT